MSTYALPEHHIVTVCTLTEDDWTSLASVEFVCTAAEDAPCRTYPECGCKAFTQDDDNPGHDHAGHPHVPGRECWVQGWFDAEADGLATTYTGADRTDATDCGVPLVAQHGHVDVVGYDQDTGPEWQWSGMPVRDEEDPHRLPMTAPAHVPGQEAFDFSA